MSHLRVFITSVLVMTLLVLLASIVLVWTMPDYPDNVRQTVCLPRIMPDGSRSSNLHCGDMAEMLRTFLETATVREYNKVKASDIKMRKELHQAIIQKGLEFPKWRRQPAAQVTGQHLPEPRPSDFNSSLVPIRSWRCDRHNSKGGFIRHGIKYKNGRLLVPVNGTYSIYTFLDMQEYSDLDRASRDDVVQMSIFKYNIVDGQETELISAVEPRVIDGTRKSNIYSMYLSSIVELKRGDELAVKCSDIAYLKSPVHNYFGVHLL